MRLRQETKHEPTPIRVEPLRRLEATHARRRQECLQLCTPACGRPDGGDGAGRRRSSHPSNRARPRRSGATRPARMTGDANHIPRSRGLPRAHPSRFGVVRPVVHTGVFRVVVPVPAQRRNRGLGGRPTRLPLHLSSSPRSLRSGVARSQCRQAGDRAAPRLRYRSPRPRAAVARIPRSRADEARRAGRPRRAPGDHPRHDLAGRRPAGRFGHCARRRIRAPPQPERRPSGGSRRAARSRPVRRAAAPVLGRHLVPGRLRLPSRGESAARGVETHRRDGTRRALRRGRRRRARVPRRGPAVLPRP